MQPTAKGIILPSTIADAFKPLTYQMPVGMLPIVNKPLMEHQVELFVRNGVKTIRMSCNHLSNKVQSYFDDGARWGASISYNFERPPFGLVAALRQMRPSLEGETLVILPSHIVTDLDLREALEFHWSKTRRRNVRVHDKRVARTWFRSVVGRERSRQRCCGAKSQSPQIPADGHGYLYHRA